MVILPLPKAASFSFPLPKLLVTTSWGGWSQGWRRGELNLGHVQSEHKRASKKTGEGAQQGHLPWSQGTASLAPESDPLPSSIPGSILPMR